MPPVLPPSPACACVCVVASLVSFLPPFRCERLIDMPTHTHTHCMVETELWAPFYLRQTPQSSVLSSLDLVSSLSYSH